MMQHYGSQQNYQNMRIIENREIFASPHTEGMITMTPFGPNAVLTGFTNGQIKLWTVVKNQLSCSLLLSTVYTGHAGSVKTITLLPNNRFLSTSQDSSLRIWNMNTGLCEKVLRGGSILLDQEHDVVAWPNGLVAIAGYCSPAWGCFDVWDTQTGQCLFSQHGYVHRPHGISLAVEKSGYLVVHGHCTYEANLWKVDRTQCVLLNKCPGERIYSMAALPTGAIVACAHDLYIYEVNLGVIGCVKRIPGTHVIDKVIPFGNHSVLTLDRQNANRGTLKLWDLALGNCYSLGDCVWLGVQQAYDHCKLEGGLVLSIVSAKFCIQNFFPIPN